MSVVRNQTLTALDVGTGKVCCFVARVETNSSAKVIGIGHQISQGLRAGNVVDMRATEDAIRSAIDAAERMAGEKVRDIYLGFSGGRPQSKTISAEVTVSGHAINDTDLRRVMHHSQLENEDHFEVVHQLPVGFTIDGTVGVRDPRGMFASSLGVNTHIVSAVAGPVQNLRLCAEQGHVSVADVAVAPYTAGLATLVEDELRLGATVVDMGAGTTSIGVFCDDEMVYTKSLPLGGSHITNDIARGLGTPTVHAERLKTLYGNVLPSPADDRDILEVSIMGETEETSRNQVSRSMLVGIIRPRVEEILEMVRDRLEASGMSSAAGRRVVLTGGASQLQGIRELAARVLDKQVRIGRPININGLAESTGGPAFASCAGLLRFAMREPVAATGGLNGITWANNGSSKFAKISRWIAQNF